MNTFRLIISTPDGKLYDEKTVKLSVRGIEGELAVLAGHIPFITSLKPCDCRVENGEGIEKTGHIDGGLLAVTNEKVTLLSGSFCWK